MMGSVFVLLTVSKEFIANVCLAIAVLELAGSNVAIIVAF
jgi:hypothetical protein